MSGFLTNLFAMSAVSDKSPELKQRQVAFTDSRLVFSMPENFSTDFPADDLLESVDLNNPALFTDANKKIIMRRWWDFTESGFFTKKEIGTLMLTIYVNKSATEYTDRISLIDVIHKDLETQYKESNKGTQAGFQYAYPETYESFNEKVFNQQRWLNYPVAMMNATEATISYVSPLTSQYYLEFAFTLMPSTKVNTREFEDNYSRDFIQRIMQSVSIDYTSSAVQKSMGVDIDAIELNELVTQHTDRLQLK